jgi:hypothetical protein
VAESENTGLKKNVKAELIALVSLFALVWAPFIARMVAGASALSGPLTHDIGLQWIPFRLFIKHSLAQGVFPLWAPQVFAGFPFAAFSHTGVFYPPGVLLLAADYARAVNFFYPLHLCIAGSGVYALCRRLGLGPPAAWFAALSYTFTGKPYYFIHFLPAACSNAWVPWFIFSALGLLRSGRRRHLVLAALFLALQVLGGDVESTSYGLLFAFPFLIVSYRGTGASLKGVAALLAALFLAVLLCLVQLLPLFEYSQHFVRNQGVTFAYFSQRQLPLSIVWAALLPVRGLESAAEILNAPYFYLGLLTLGMALFAGWKKVNKSSRGIGLLALIAFAWSFGSIPLLDRLQFLLPLLGRFGAPEHAYFMGQLFLAVLAGQGLQALDEWGDEKKAAGSAMAVLLFGIALALIGMALFDRASEFLSNPRLTVLLFASALPVIFIFLRFIPGRVRAVSIFLILALQVFDIYVPAFLHLPHSRPHEFNYSDQIEKTASQIRRTGSRCIMVSRQGVGDPELLYHAGLALDFDAVDGWITVPPRRYAELLALADPRAARFKEGRLDHLGVNSDLRDGRFIDAPGMPVLDLINLRWIIDRGLPLKFSSPFFFKFFPPDYHRRTVPDGSAAMLEAGERAFPEKNLDSLVAGPNEIYRYRLYIHPGDRLVFGADAYHTRKERSAVEFEARVEIEYGESVDVLYAVTARSEEGRAALKGSRKGRNLPPIGFEVSRNLAKGTGRVNVTDLSRYAEREVRISFVTTGPDRSDLAFLWRSPAVVNDAKPIRLKARFGSDIMIYENREALPRAFVVHNAEVIAGDDELLERLGGASRHELSRTVFLENDLDDPIEPEAQAGLYSGSRESAFLESRRPGEEVYRVESRGRGLLFMSDQYYPGWRAFVGGREVPIIRADYNFRAVPVPGGKSVVRLVFIPVAFRTGLFASLASLIFTGIMISAGRCSGSKPDA